GANLILLDEPTNDLDVETLSSLEAALEDFPGCAVIISHDSFFLDRIATHILSFEGDSHVEWFEGNFESYEEDKKRRLGEDAVLPKRIKYKKFARTVRQSVASGRLLEGIRGFFADDAVGGELLVALKADDGELGRRTEILIDGEGKLELAPHRLQVADCCAGGATPQDRAWIGHGAGELDAFDAGERFRGLANIVAALLQTRQSAVDPSRRGADIVTVAIGIELPPLPIFAGDLQRQRRLSGHGRIVLKIHPQRLAVFGIVGAAGKLEQDAAVLDAD